MRDLDLFWSSLQIVLQRISLWSPYINCKSMQAKFKNISIAYDMASKEREECKALVQTAKDKTENEAGEWVYRVRGPKGK